MKIPEEELQNYLGMDMQCLDDIAVRHDLRLILSEFDKRTQSEYFLHGLDFIFLMNQSGVSFLSSMGRSGLDISVSDSVMRRMFNRLGMPINNVKLSSNDIPYLNHDLNNRMPLEEIVDKYGLSAKKIFSYLMKQHGKNPDSWDTDMLEHYIKEKVSLTPPVRRLYEKTREELLPYAKEVPDIGYVIGSVNFKDKKLRISINESPSALDWELIEDDFNFFLSPPILKFLSDKKFQGIDPHAPLFDFDFQDSTLIISPGQETGNYKPHIGLFLEAYSMVLNQGIQK